MLSGIYFVFGVRMLSDFILFHGWGTPYGVLQSGCSPFPSQASVEEGSLVCTSSQTDCLQSVWQQPSLPMWYDTSLWFRIAFLWYSVMLTSFRVTFLECDLNLHLEIGFLNACLVLDSFLITTPRTFLRYKCFLLTAPGSLWILNSPGTALSGVIT